MQAVILAGGLGTRLRPVTERVPKALVPVGGRPFLEYELELMRSGGVDEFVICVGHLGEAIREHFGDGGRFGLTIRYSDDGRAPLGPSGALKKAGHLLRDRFFVTYGDAYLRAPFKEVMDSLSSSGALGVMTVFRNEDRYGRSDVDVAGGRVVAYDKRGERKHSWVNFGLTALKKSALDRIPAGRAVEEEEFYKGLIAKGELAAFPVRLRFYEIGNPKSLAEFERFMARRINRGTSKTNLR